MSPKFVNKCILSFPDYFSFEQQQQLQQVVELSGMSVLRMEKESLCIGHYINNEVLYDERLYEWKFKNTLVFNLTDNNLIVSVIEFVDDLPHLIGYQVSNRISNDKLVKSIIAHLEKEIFQSYGVDLLNGSNEKFWQKDYNYLYEEINSILISFSQADSMDIELPSTCIRLIRKVCKNRGEDPIEYISLSYGSILSILHSFLDGILSVINNCLNSCHVQSDSIFYVFPVGRLSQIAFIQNYLKRVFGDQRIFQRHSSITSIISGLGRLLL